MVANRNKPDHTGLAVVPGRSAPSADVQGEGDNVGQERADRFLPGRAHLCTAVAERRDDIARICKVVDREIDAVRRKTEVVGQAPPRDPRDERATVALHGRQA
jgi:hypothetical protein